MYLSIVFNGFLHEIIDKAGKVVNLSLTQLFFYFAFARVLSVSWPRGVVIDFRFIAAAFRRLKFVFKQH